MTSRLAGLCKALAVMSTTALTATLFPAVASATAPDYYFDSASGVLTVMSNAGAAIAAVGEEFDCDVTSDKTLKKVIFEPEVTQINDEFKGCTTLSEIHFSTALQTIGDWAFYNTGITHADMSNTSLVSIGSHAFRSSHLIEVKFPTSLQAIGRTAFFEISGLNSIDLSHTSVTNIGASAFEIQSLANVSFPPSLQSIGISAFKGTRITDIDLSKTSLTVINDKAFTDSNLANVTFPTSLKVIGISAFAKTALLNVDLTGTSVSYIGENAFANNAGLAKVRFPASLQTIGDYAFYGTALTSIDLSDTKLTNVGASAFAIQRLGSVQFPATLKAIADGAFAGAVLTRVDLSNTDLSNIGSRAFASNRSLSSVKLPASLQTIGEYAFSSTVLTNVDLSNTRLTDIGEWAFQDTGLASVRFPATLVRIGDYAFYHLHSLTQLRFARSTSPKLGRGVFAGIADNGTIYYPNGGTGYTTTAFNTASDNNRFDVWSFIPVTPEITPNAELDFVAEKLTGLLADTRYAVNGVAYDTDSAGTIAIDAAWPGTSLSVIKKGNDIATSDSAAQILSVPARPVAPEVTATDETFTGANDGKIVGANTEMEYKLATAGIWISITDTEVSNLAPGTYLVRVKASATNFAGLSATVVLNNGNIPPDVDVPPSTNTPDATPSLPPGTDVPPDATLPDNGSGNVTSPSNILKVDALHNAVKTVYLKQKSSYRIQIGAYLKNALTRQKISFKSSNVKVATVSNTGKINTKAVKKPTKVVIIATAGVKKLKVTLWVTPKTAKAKKVAVRLPASLVKGKIGWIGINPGKATNPKISITSSNKKVVTVNKHGQIKALTKGATKIRISVGGKRTIKILKVK